MVDFPKVEVVNHRFPFLTELFDFTAMTAVDTHIVTHTKRYT